MTAQLESTKESIAALAFATAAPVRHANSPVDRVQRDIHLELLARDFVRWFPEEAKGVASAGARKLEAQLNS